MNGLKPSQRALDLGSGAGSFTYESCSCPIIAVDSDFLRIVPSGRALRVCADSAILPFASRSFDLVICHHSLEHFRSLQPALEEIRRVLKENGKLFISIPDGYSFSDRLYRLLLAGGGHVNQFGFDNAIRLIEGATHLHLAAWKTLYSSFIYLDKSNFVPAPLGRLPGPLPRRMRWLGVFPRWSFGAGRFLLNVGGRLVDRYAGSQLSLYGWACAFDSLASPPIRERSYSNVCMHCGFGAERSKLLPIYFFFYRCISCKGLNPLFRDS
jgi:SAM-dependent methyltransferase